MAFDSTPGGANATSYVSKEEAKEYFKDRLHSDLWAGYADQKPALITASRLLDRWVKWEGVKTSSGQSLDWPRNGVDDKDGYNVDRNIIPRNIKDATCEMAYAMLEEDLTAPNDMAGIASLKVGTLSIVADRFDRPSTIPEAVWMAIGVYGKRPSKHQVRVERS